MKQYEQLAALIEANRDSVVDFGNQEAAPSEEWIGKAEAYL